LSASALLPCGFHEFGLRLFARAVFLSIASIAALGNLTGQAVLGEPPRKPPLGPPLAIRPRGHSMHSSKAKAA